LQKHGTTAEYFLSDALGSVRQLTNGNGDIASTKSYDPYGVVTQTSGASQSAYGIIMFHSDILHPLDVSHIIDTSIFID